MNEQIKKLMEEAGYAAPEIAGRANVFAELLIKECAKYVADSNLVGIPRDNIPGGMVRYFGVEE